MFNQSSHDVINNLNREQYTSFIQDPVHIGTKLRNRLLKASVLLPMGKGQVTVSHLKILISMVKKEIHGLVKTDICPEDRQNFGSFLKVSSEQVLNALQTYVNDSHATIVYLEISRGIIDSFTDLDLDPLQRTYKMWYGVFFLEYGENGSLKAECTTSVKISSATMLLLA